MCSYIVRVNGGDVSGYMDDGEQGGCVRLRSVKEHKHLTNVAALVA